ncbi:MAG TPA: hypothetical protein VER12_01650 [Polyangiaceae bacterium]|nr:hypothetical protein [Polyangiaceae bacterium]
MNSAPDFDDEDFFGSYDADQANAGMSFEFDDPDARPPTREQLAHLTRFRKPVAAVVSALGLLSIVALASRGAPRYVSERALVAHYGAALPAPTSETRGRAQLEGATQGGDASSALAPEAWSAFVTEAIAVLVPEAACTATTAQSTLAMRASGASPEPASLEQLTHYFTAPTSSATASSVEEFAAAITATCRLR